ncbi:hypothetical protein DSCO28_07710 [Desulfosarcina ovata subsp. sediminis]|uniref:Uncharacterized protein n=1 Tax=Desulfosarcina ovata subsp. sediminis TaxID=885957 RepID=A0A5K7ZJ23_9BACT|nr:hypothetical protein [Desulfosarcina ovata]BBO80205.1 hypothetical protein DSCO28_07710 [Desulfosarcina ovata subsp. sediminis]
MSRRKEKIDPNQMEFEFEFGDQVDRYIEVREQIKDAIEQGPPAIEFENEFEICAEIAVAAKRSLREWGGSRDDLVDAINAYFGRTQEGAEAIPPTCRNPLTKNMLNNYFSKPNSYPMPAYLLVAIQQVTGRMYPAEAIVGYGGAKVATGAELRQMTLGKLEENMDEMRKLKRELRRR